MRASERANEPMIESRRDTDREREKKKWIVILLFLFRIRVLYTMKWARSLALSLSFSFSVAMLTSRKIKELKRKSSTDSNIKSKIIIFVSPETRQPKKKISNLILLNECLFVVVVVFFSSLPNCKRQMVSYVPLGVDVFVLAFFFPQKKKFHLISYGPCLHFAP